MKEKLQNKKVIVIAVVVLAIMALAAVISLIVRENSKKKQPANHSSEVEEQGKTRQIFGFETYEDMVGARIVVDNLFGKIVPNQNKAYITQGKGSMRLEVAGDYGMQEQHPYIQLSCVDSTIETADFSQFYKITFDVYNDMDEELHVMTSITANDFSEAANIVSEQTFSLAPNAWTTCSLMLDSEKIAIGYYDMRTVSYITFTFLEHKTSKEDPRNVLYIDNLLGHYSEEEWVVPKHDYNFYEGITFENTLDQKLLTGAKGTKTACQLSRIAYSDEGIAVSDKFGQYGMRADVKAGMTLPTITVYFGENLPAGTIVTFDMYVAAEEKAGYFYRVQSANNIYKSDGYQFNQWNEIAVQMSATSNTFTFYCQLDQSMLGLGLDPGYMFGDKDTIFYLDNIKVTSADAPAKMENGVLTISNAIGTDQVGYSLQRAFKKGQIVNFDFDITEAKGCTLWVLENGDWKAQHRFDYVRWPGKRNVTLQITQDVAYIRFHIRYDGDVDLKKCKTIISNIQEGVLNADLSNGLTFESGYEQLLIQEGEATEAVASYPQRVSYKEKGITPNSGLGKYGIELLALEGTIWPEFLIDCQKTIPADTILTFMAYVAVDNPGEQTFSMEAYNPADKIGDRVYNRVVADRSFNEWFEVKIQLKADANQQAVLFNFRTQEIDPVTGMQKRTSIFEDKDVKIYLDNFKVTKSEPNAEVNNGVITVNNPFKQSEVSYDYIKSYKKGEVINFDFDMNAPEGCTLWVLENGRWTSQHRFDYVTWPGKRNVTIQLTQDVEFLRFHVRYNNIKTPDFSIDNQADEDEYTYTLQKEYKKGQTFSFDVDIANTKECTLWVLENGNWNAQHRFDSNQWPANQNLELQFTQDVKYLTFHVRYKGDVDYSKCKCLISNIQEVDFAKCKFKISNIQSGKLTADVYKGLTFEQGFEQLLIAEGESVKTAVSYPKRVAYSEQAVTTVEGLGEYGIELTVPAGTPWPEFDICYPETIPSGSVLTFMVYVKADNPENRAYKIESYNSTEETTDKVYNSVLKNFPYNEWYEVTMLLNGDTKAQTVYFNFATKVVDEATGKEKNVSMFADEEVKIYLDNFKVTTGEPPVQEENGVITINNPLGESYVIYNLQESYQANQFISFDFDTTTTEDFSLWVLENGDWNAQHRFDYTTWSSKQNFTIQLTQDVEFLQFYVRYSGNVDFGKLKSIISDIQVDDITIVNPDGEEQVWEILKVQYKEGQTVSFDFDTTAKSKFTLWVLENGDWQRQHRFDYTTWSGKENLAIQLTQDVEYLQFHLKYSGDADRSKCESSISNIQTDNLTIMNPDGKDQVWKTLYASHKAGQSLSFDLDTTATGKFTLWVLENGSWQKQHRFNYTQLGEKQTLSIQLQGDVNYLTFHIRYEDGGTYNKYVSTISNIKKNN